MPNFFKKLTSSFRMQEEGEPQNEEAMPDELEVVEEEQHEIEEQHETSEPEPEGDGGAIQSADTQGEQPYTIAELARASTSAKKSVFVKGSEVSMPSAPEGQLAIDVYETPSEIVIKSTIAGVKIEDLDIGIEENTVNIRGARHNEEKVRGEDYFYQECYWGTFSRSIILPTEVDNENASAALEDGILTIRLPKIKKAKETKIKIVKG